jgi:two-component system, OmpR family, sensor kinase
VRWRAEPIGPPADVGAPVSTGSLRGRLVAATVALLFVVLVSLGVLVNTILSERLHSDLRQSLSTRAKFASVLSARGLTGQQLADALTGQGITTSVQVDGSTFIGRDQPRPNGQNGPGGPGTGNRGGPANQNASLAAAGSPVTITQQGDQLFARVDVGSSDLLLTTSQGDIEHTLSVLKTTELAAGAAFLLIAGVVSFMVVRGALGPLRKMSALADRIRAGDRGLRLRPSRPETDLGRTATALDAMLDSLEAAEADAQSAELRMRQFLADASHDLRTPLAVMSAAAEQLLRSDPGRVERERRLVELIREGRRAGRLVDDLLLMARLDEADPSAALLREQVDVTELVSSAVARARFVIRERTIELHVEADPVIVLADADRLTRVVTNLLDNARDATTPGGHIWVQVAAVGSWCVVDVRDDGAGIPADAHDRVFDRFVRLDSGRRRDAPDPSDGRSGAGLGLPIARAIARGHGGELTSWPAPTGAHLRLELPLLPQSITSARELAVVAPANRTSAAQT